MLYQKGKRGTKEIATPLSITPIQGSASILFSMAIGFDIIQLTLYAEDIAYISNGINKASANLFSHTEEIAGSGLGALPVIPKKAK